MDKVAIELPESVTQELDNRHIPLQRVRMFVVQAIEAWLRVQDQQDTADPNAQPPSRFSESALPFAEKLVNENRELFEQLSKLSTSRN